MRVPFAAAAGVVLLWIAAAYALDRLVIRPAWPAATSSFALTFQLEVPGVSLRLPPVSVLVLLVLPFVVFGLLVLPWRSLASREAWGAWLATWLRPLGLLAGVALAVPIGEGLRLLVSGVVPEGLKAFMDAFSLGIGIRVFDAEPLTLEGTLAGTLCFAGAALAFVHFGARGALEALTFEREG